MPGQQRLPPSPTRQVPAAGVGPGIPGDDQDRLGNGFIAEQLGQGPAGPPGAVAWFGNQADVPDAGATGTPPPDPVIQDADSAQTVEIKDAVEGAREMVANGIGILASGGGSDQEKERIEYNFHTLEPSVLGEAQGVLSTTQGGLAGEVPIEVEGSVFPWQDEKKVAAYVYGGPFADTTAIHLAPLFFKMSADSQASTIVHEATHKYAGTNDYAYAGSGKFSDLEPDYAVWNADSYANFCQLVQGDIDEREGAEESARLEQVAKENAAVLWDAYARGEIELYRNEYTLEDGTVLPKGAVGRAIPPYFAEHFPERRAEVVAAIASGTTEGPFTCSDGFVVRDDLFMTVYHEEGYE